MSDFNWGQTLIVAPEVSFERIDTVLIGHGWKRDNAQQSAPLLPGEPEHAAWSWPTGKPYVIYTFNPVARLRVLDVATVPPALRAAMARELRLLGREEVDDLLFESDPRKRLLGLWALQETERIDLISQTIRLSTDHEPAVAGQAREIRARLESIQEARESLLITLRLVAEASKQVIVRLGDPLFTQGLKPSRSDLEALFDSAAASGLIEEIEETYRTPPVARLDERYPELEVYTLTAGLLRWPNELSEKFPGGYRNIAGWMNPRWIWCAWRWCNDEGRGVHYDGLAFVEQRWVWMPKIFRALSRHLFATAPGAEAN